MDAEAATQVAQALADKYGGAGPADDAPVAATENGDAHSNKRKLDDVADGAEEPRKKSNFSSGPIATEEVPQAATTEGTVQVKEEVPPGAEEATEAPAPAGDAEVKPASLVTSSGLTQGPTGEMQEIIHIPSSMVGKLIGKSGETIKQVQNSTGTRIQIDHQLPGETKQVTISGATAGNVASCKAQVEQIVSDEPLAGDTTRSLDCPQGIVGRIIGRGGETIRALQQASQAHIVVDQNYPEGEPRKVNISGRTDSVDRACKMVEELITGEPGSAQAIIQKYGAGVSKVIECNKSIVGRVIGKGGDTIKTLQRNFGANIQIDQSTDPMKITIAGQPGSVEAAAAAVKEIVEGGNPYLGGPGGPQAFGQGGPRGGPGFGGPGFGVPPFGGFPGYGGFPGGFPQAGFGGFPGAYPQAYPQAAYGGYGGAAYGQDPYTAAAAATTAYGGGQAAAGGGAAAASVWQELQDEQGRSYYYNTQTGVSQWEKPSE